jgi:hypothetical protein
VWLDSAISRAGLAASTGLNTTTISGLIEERIADRFVREIGCTPQPVGQSGVLMELHSQQYPKERKGVVGGVERAGILARTIRSN